MTRKQFLLTTAGLAGAANAAEGAPAPPPRVLLVVAHPDDEYAFAATAYRIGKELGGTVDQVVITDGAGGYRYSSLAERVYGISFTSPTGRGSLPQIRRRETLAAGRILGIRKHYFLNQPDSGFTLEPDQALASLWKAAAVTDFISELLRRGKYQFVFTLLPTAETHGHHRAAALLAQRAVERQPAGTRPVLFGADPGSASHPTPVFTGDPSFPALRALPDAPVFAFDRRAAFGFNQALSYQIVVNWMIAEHKSQGLFQTDFNRHDLERYWLLANGTAGSVEKADALFRQLAPGGVR